MQTFFEDIASRLLRRSRFSLSYVLYMSALGFAGWVLLAQPGLLGLAGLPRFHLEGFATFVIVGLIASALGVQVAGTVNLSLDSAFHLAAVFCLGPVWGGRAVALTMGIGSVLAFQRRLRSGDLPDRATILTQLLRMAYVSGMTGGLWFLVAKAFDLEARIASGGIAPLTLAWLLPVAGMTLLLLHYGIQGYSFFLSGLSRRDVLRKVVVPGILLEAALLPVALVLALVYPVEQGTLGIFILICATYLIINYAYRGISRARDALAQRVAELETLAITSREISRSLERGELIDRLRKETLKLVDPAERFVIGLWSEEEKGFAIEVYDRDGLRLHRTITTGGAEPEDAVIQERRAVFVVDLERLARASHPPPMLALPTDPGIATIAVEGGERRALSPGPRHGSGRWTKPDPPGRLEPDRFADARGPRFRTRRGSWLGYPLIVYDEVFGLIAVECDRRRGFSVDHERVLGAIAGQAAIAIQNSHLYELATVDGLTELYVRRYFDQRLAEEVQRGDRLQTPFSLILLDLDNFKMLNDTHGHPVGDRVLRDVAAVVRRSMRGLDIPARYGGEEFAFILPGTDLRAGQVVAERICRDIRQYRLRVRDRDIRVTASLGVAGFEPGAPPRVDDMLGRADAALYEAKRLGKDRVVVCDGTRDELREVAVGDA